VGLVAVQTYLQGVLSELIVPGTGGNTLECFITPPSPEYAPTPKAYVWASQGNETRESMPRNLNGTIGTAAWKETHHQVDVFIVWFSDESADAADLDFAFPAIVDAIMWRIRTVPNPAVCLDPLTGRESQLLDVGERMSYDAPGVRSTNDQRISRYDARLQLEIMEVFQA
jgi:hypothetical protein